MGTYRDFLARSGMALCAWVTLVLFASAGLAQESDSGDPPLGTIAGTVRGFDDHPVAGAYVYLSGTDRVARTGAQGGFRFDSVPAGRHAVEVQHPDPLLESVTGPAKAVEVIGGQVAQVSLVFSSSQAAAQLCGIFPADSGAAVPLGVLMGLVLDEATGQPLEAAVVWMRAEPEKGVEGGAEKEARQARTERKKRNRALRKSSRPVAMARRSAKAETYLPPVISDSTGEFLACGVPAGVPVEVQTTAMGRVAAPQTVRIPKSGLLVREFLVPPDTVKSEVPVAEVGRGNGVVLRGVVRSTEKGDPVSGARVRILGTDLVRITGREGSFVITGLRPGPHRIVTDYLGMSSDTAQVMVAGEAVVSVVLRLQTQPVKLPNLDVEVAHVYHNPRLAEYYHRVEKGIGDYIPREELQHVDVVGAFRRLPSVSVENCLRSGIRDSSCWTLRITRGIGIGTNSCSVALYVNGARVSEDDFTYITKLPRDLIEGIEVYRGAVGQPAQYRGVDTGCGLVLVWLAQP